MGILSRLMILVLLVLTPAVGVQAINEWLLYRDRNQELHGLAQRSADIYNTEIDQITHGLQRLLGALAQLPAIRSMDRSACASLLHGLANRYPQDVGLAVAGLDGRVRCGSQPPATPVSIADRRFLAAAAHGFTVGTFTTSPLDGAPALPFGKPVLGTNGQATGVVVAYLPLQRLASDLERPALGAGQSLTVVDGDGVVLAHLPAGELAAGTKLPPHLLTAMHDPAPGVMEQSDLHGRPTIFGYVPITMPPPDIYLLYG